MRRQAHPPPPKRSLDAGSALGGLAPGGRRCAACSDLSSSRAQAPRQASRPLMARRRPALRLVGVGALLRHARAWPRCCLSAARRLPRGDPPALRHPLRLDLGRLLDRRRWAPAWSSRARQAQRGPRARRVRPLDPRGAHGDHHADLQRARADLFARPRATFESLCRHRRIGELRRLRLSDTSEPDIRAAEQRAWEDLRPRWPSGRAARRASTTAGASAASSARPATSPTSAAAGAALPLPRRLDADSVMTGECLTTLVRLMEAHPDRRHHPDRAAGRGHERRYARVQQFATRALRAAVHRRLPSGSSANRTTGATTRSCACAVHPAMRARAAARAPARSRARSCRTISSRRP